MSPHSDLHLPKNYLSYSAADLWYSSKSAYRSRYYFNALEIASPQMDFGKEVADLLKDHPDDPRVAHVPKYPIRDQGFMVDISGVPLLMYPDTLSLNGVPSFREYKTSEWVEGKPTWDQQRVDSHMQLKVYSLGILTKYKNVNDLCHLDWLLTRMVDHTDPVKIFGRKYDVTIQLPELTGEIISFECVVTDKERYRAREWLVQAAHEISADYKNHLKNI